MKPTCFDKLLVRCRRESWRGRIRIVSFLHFFILPNHAVVMICEPDGKVGHELLICFDILQYNRK